MSWLFNQPLRQAIKAIDVALAEVRASGQALKSTDLCDLIQLAIHHGAPIYNRGAHRDCTAIYLHLAQGVLELLSQAETADCSDHDASLRQFACSKLRPLAAANPVMPADDKAANQLAWDLRHIFDNIGEVAATLMMAFMILDTSLESIQVSGHEIDATIIGGLIAIAIHHGAPVYNLGSRKGCADIYLSTAQGVVGLLPSTGVSEIQQLARAQLAPLAAANPVMPADDKAVNQLAWDLRHAFDRILAKVMEQTEKEEEEAINTPLDLGKVKELKDWAGGVDVANVAVVFTDVIESTRLNCEKGNAEWMSIVEKHMKHGEALIAREHGYLIKTIGDSLMAVFHSAIHALNFALALECNTGHAEIAIRVGIHVGPIMVSRGDAMGTTVNMAARVQSHAEKGGVCISDQVKQDIDLLGFAAHAQLPWEDPHEVELKGFPQKYKLWIVPPSKVTAG